MTCFYVLRDQREFRRSMMMWWVSVKMWETCWVSCYNPFVLIVLLFFESNKDGLKITAASAHKVYTRKRFEWYCYWYVKSKVFVFLPFLLKLLLWDVVLFLALLIAIHFLCVFIKDTTQPLNWNVWSYLLMHNHGDNWGHLKHNSKWPSVI